MKFRGRIIGLTIGFFQSSGWAFYDYFRSDGEISFLFTITYICVYSFIGLWIGKRFDQIHFLSEKDALTGLYNRRYIDLVFPKILAQVNRKKEKLTVSMLDCNNFKMINDEYGHKTGDLVITNLSQLLVKSTRNSDITARWGGDEFLIVAPYTDTNGTKELINRIEAGLEELSKEMQINISVSIGTAEYPTDADNIEDLIMKADQNMYEIKANKDS